MLNKLAGIRRALDAGAYESALAMALTIPDIWGQVEYPEEKRVGRRYMDWFDEYVYPDHFRYDGLYKEHYAGTEFNGEACYQLRCHVLHSGDADISDKTPITKFSLCLSSTDDTGIYASNHGVMTSGDTVERHVWLDIRGLCRKLCLAGQDYYESRDPAEFRHKSIEIVDIEKYTLDK